MSKDLIIANKGLPVSVLNSFGCSFCYHKATDHCPHFDDDNGLPKSGICSMRIKECQSYISFPDKPLPIELIRLEIAMNINTQWLIRTQDHLKSIEQKKLDMERQYEQNRHSFSSEEDKAWQSKLRSLQNQVTQADIRTNIYLKHQMHYNTEIAKIKEKNPSISIHVTTPMDIAELLKKANAKEPIDTEFKEVDELR